MTRVAPCHGHGYARGRLRCLRGAHDRASSAGPPKAKTMPRGQPWLGCAAPPPGLTSSSAANRRPPEEAFSLSFMAFDVAQCVINQCGDVFVVQGIDALPPDSLHAH